MILSVINRKNILLGVGYGDVEVEGFFNGAKSRGSGRQDRHRGRRKLEDENSEGLKRRGDEKGGRERGLGGGDQGVSSAFQRDLVEDFVDDTYVGRGS